jgi:hypothetical protein
MNRLIALTLLALIGSPECWCCLVTPAKKAHHDCCNPAAAGNGPTCPLQQSKPMGRHSLGCDYVSPPRDTASAAADIPQPTISVFHLSFDFQWGMSATRPPVAEHWWNADTGPPPPRLPLFVRHHALLL